MGRWESRLRPIIAPPVSGFRSWSARGRRMMRWEEAESLSGRRADACGTHTQCCGFIGFALPATGEGTGKNSALPVFLRGHLACRSGSQPNANPQSHGQARRLQLMEPASRAAPRVAKQLGGEITPSTYPSLTRQKAICRRSFASPSTR
jgi:hypothetical protein